MAAKRCKKGIRLRMGGEVLVVACQMIKDSALEKKYPHKSHVGHVVATSGEEAQVLWKDATEHGDTEQR